jgi:hypothetical protein
VAGLDLNVAWAFLYLGGLIEAACARIVILFAEIDFDSVVFLRTGWLEGCLYRTLYGGG